MNFNDSLDDLVPLGPINPIIYDNYQTLGLCKYTNHKKSFKNDSKTSFNQNRFDLLFLDDCLIYKMLQFFKNSYSFKDLNEITKPIQPDEAKEELKRYVESHFLCAKKPLKYIEVTNCETVESYKYVLETFTETRTTYYSCEPASKTEFDHFTPNKQPESPWAIKVKPKVLFRDETVRIEIPNTSQIEICNNCDGFGSKTCESCRGNSYKKCWVCSGNGLSRLEYRSHSFDSYSGNRKSSYYEDYHHNLNNYKSSYNHHYSHNQYNPHRDFATSHHQLFHPTFCTNCNGRGIRKCSECTEGQMNCRVCDSMGYLRWFIELKIQFENNIDSFYKNAFFLSDDVVKDCKFIKIYSAKSNKLSPLDNHPCFELKHSSRELLNSHFVKFSNSRILAQRHEIFALPVSLCSYELKNKKKVFYIIGFERKIYAPKYPSNILCCNLI